MALIIYAPNPKLASKIFIPSVGACLVFHLEVIARTEGNEIDRKASDAIVAAKGKWQNEPPPKYVLLHPQPAGATEIVDIAGALVYETRNLLFSHHTDAMWPLNDLLGLVFYQPQGYSFVPYQVVTHAAFNKVTRVWVNKNWWETIGCDELVLATPSKQTGTFSAPVDVKEMDMLKQFYLAWNPTGSILTLDDLRTRDIISRIDDDAEDSFL